VLRAAIVFSLNQLQWWWQRYQTLYNVPAYHADGIMVPGARDLQRRYLEFVTASMWRPARGCQGRTSGIHCAMSPRQHGIDQTFTLDESSELVTGLG